MHWRRAAFKGKKVWVRVNEQGRVMVEGGRVPMRYSDRSGAKIYRAGAGKVRVDEDAPVELLEGGVSADAVTKKKGRGQRGSGFGSAGRRSAAQAALAADAARALLDDLPEDAVVAYTDGACKGNPGPAGAGVRVELPGGRVAEASRSLGLATNNVGELTAVDMALDLLDEAEVAADTSVALLTDSKYSHGVLVRGWKAKANRELILGIRSRLEDRPGVRLHWVAGHVGIDGNECADALANDGVAGRTRTRWTERG